MVGVEGIISLERFISSLELQPFRYSRDNCERIVFRNLLLDPHI